MLTYDDWRAMVRRIMSINTMHPISGGQRFGMPGIIACVYLYLEHETRLFSRDLPDMHVSNVGNYGNGRGGFFFVCSGTWSSDRLDALDAYCRAHEEWPFGHTRLSDGERAVLENVGALVFNACEATSGPLRRQPIITCDVYYHEADGSEVALAEAEVAAAREAGQPLPNMGVMEGHVVCLTAEHRSQFRGYPHAAGPVEPPPPPPPQRVKAVAHDPMADSTEETAL